MPDILTGAAGFIGSHITARLLGQGKTLIGVDNLSLGRREHITAFSDHPNFKFVECDLNNVDKCHAEFEKLLTYPVSTIWHFAANSDIAAGVKDPDIDLQNTFLTTYNSLKLARLLGVKQFVFASTSAIYGDHPGILSEDTGPLFPISNYGAMKLASEGAISAAVEQFLEKAWIFRFPNVVGPKATHGVIYDFIHKIKKTPDELVVLGDGNQSKPYLHVSDLIDAIMCCYEKSQNSVNCFNIGLSDSETSVRTIAESVVNQVSPNAKIRYTGGKKGWPGDVPRFQYSTAKIRKLGWQPQMTSDEAVHLALKEILAEL